MGADEISYQLIDCMGMGRQIAGIELPGFADAIQNALSRGVRVRVIGVKEGEVRCFTGRFLSCGAAVRYFDHGDARIALADGKFGLLAFAPPCAGIHTKRSYTGILIEDEIFWGWLKKRFDESWDCAKTPSESFMSHLREDFLRSPASIIAALISALIGALAMWLVG